MAGARIEEYAKCFARLRTDKSAARWSAETVHRAPHKPLLLLSVLDLLERDEISSNNLIELTPELGELFTGYWNAVFPFERPGNIALPFFHLRSEGFWKLVPRPGGEVVVRSASQIRSISDLDDNVIGACLDDGLYALLQAGEHRERLRSVLVHTHFAPPLHEPLLGQGVVNYGAYFYGKRLLEQAIAEVMTEEEVYQPVWGQGFRRAVVIAYDHRCALCGIRVRTLDGHTAVAAAHIVPWSESRDDRPANGMALCGTCHWAFDEGMMGISGGYEILASAQLRATGNFPSYLSTLEKCSIFRPEKEVYWPDPGSLSWHRQHVFLSR